MTTERDSGRAAGEAATSSTITIKEACAILGVGDKTMRRYIKKHGLSTTRHYENGSYTLLLARQEVEALDNPIKTLAKVQENLTLLDQWGKSVQWVQGVVKTLELAMKAQEEHNRRQEDLIREEAARGRERDRNLRRARMVQWIVAVLVAGAVITSYAALRARTERAREGFTAHLEELRGTLNEDARARERDRASLREMQARLEAVEREKQAEQGKRARLFGIF